MTKRILFVSYTAGSTGPTNSLTLLLRHLPGRFEPSVLLPGDGTFADALVRDGIPFFTLPNLTKWSIPAIARLIRRERFQLVYGNNDSGGTRNSFIAARLARVPFIGHAREMAWGKSWRNAGYLRFANQVVAVSEACADSLARFVPPEKLSVVHNGVTLEPVSETERRAARASLIKETGAPSDSVLVASMGHICARKGTKHAVEAVIEALNKAPAVRLLLFGSLDVEPAYADQIRALIRERGMEQRVFLLGYREDARGLLPGADVFLHPALSDPHPRAVIEAMAAGLPVVAFATDGVAETVMHGETGCLAAALDLPCLTKHLVELAANPDLRRRMGREGRSRVESCFSAAATAEKVAIIIDRTLSERPRWTRNESTCA